MGVSRSRCAWFSFRTAGCAEQQALPDSVVRANLGKDELIQTMRKNDQILVHFFDNWETAAKDPAVRSGRADERASGRAGGRAGKRAGGRVQMQAAPCF